MRWQHCCVLWPVIIIISEHHYQGERCSRVLALPVVVFVNVIVGLLCAVWAGENGMEWEWRLEGAEKQLTWAIWQYLLYYVYLT